jgi:hypothetical protein
MVGVSRRLPRWRRRQGLEIGESATYDFVISIDFLQIFSNLQGAIGTGIVNNNDLIIQLAAVEAQNAGIPVFDSKAGF